MLGVAILFGIIGVSYWPTYTSPLVVFYGIILCIFFIVPIGVIKAMTGVEINLAILAEFIGGSVVPGNALAMNYMKAYGYVPDTLARFPFTITTAAADTPPQYLDS